MLSGSDLSGSHTNSSLFLRYSWVEARSRGGSEGLAGGRQGCRGRQARCVFPELLLRVGCGRPLQGARAGVDLTGGKEN